MHMIEYATGFMISERLQTSESLLVWYFPFVTW